MAKPQTITLGRGLEIPILYEDRSVLAIDKPAGWLLVPSDWDRTGRNLQLAIESSIKGREFWASSRNLKFLRFVHRLDAETTGILLFAKSQGALPILSRLFESRQVEKIYYAVVKGLPEKDTWSCAAPVAPVQSTGKTKMCVSKTGKEAETLFRVIERKGEQSLIEARPLTGRTHQIRVHLLESGFPILGDELYGGGSPGSAKFPLALRAAGLKFRDPFSRRTVEIHGSMDVFANEFGFLPPAANDENKKRERLGSLKPKLGQNGPG